jgi:hypothetical protein
VAADFVWRKYAEFLSNLPPLIFWQIKALIVENTFLSMVCTLPTCCTLRD